MVYLSIFEGYIKLWSICIFLGEASSTSSLIVKESLPDDSYIELLDETDQTQTKDANLKPAFYVPLKNQEAFEGEDVILECVIVANPEPEVIWYRNNVPVKESKNVELLFLGDSCKLILKNVTKDESGEIKVRAINALGECQSTASLKVNPPKRSSVTPDSGTQTKQVNIIDHESHIYTHSITTRQGNVNRNNLHNQHKGNNISYK